MTIRYLADTSAIGRLQQGKAATRWKRAVTAGMIAICDPVELEILRWVPGGARRRSMQRVLRQSYPWCSVPDDVWRRAIELQDQLGDHGLHNGASVVDLLVAATAERHRLTVLHDDADYEVISRVTGLPVQRITD
ncbi:MAG: PIN domain nuclease [Dactylosporangium sp.]|nr:PIN domain nuclease [Dactylosporangium sp.]